MQTIPDLGEEIAIVGGGPAGLMAAEVLAAAGRRVAVYDAMPSLGRKFLLAGKSGLNITHSEPHERLRARFGGEADGRLLDALDAFPGEAVRAWAAGLGTETFTGSSGRVFPTVMKASPLLRAWLRRLEAAGVALHRRHRWIGFEAGGLVFETPEGRVTHRPAATLLALGGASWPRLGSDGAWVPVLEAEGVPVRRLRPANCGFDVAWSETMRERFAGEPVKAVAATSAAGRMQGEFVVTRDGVEGSLVYAHAAALRDALERCGEVALRLDLAPGRTAARLAQALARVPPRESFSNRLRKGAGLSGVKAALLREVMSPDATRDPARLAAAIKDLALPLVRPRPIAEAISSAGGIAFEAIDARFMLRARPGLFVAGEMLDWEAPTGGYLLTACLATGRAAARGIETWLSGPDSIKS